MTQTKVILLGTGTPALITGRSQSSVAIIVDGRSYVIDCGSGCIERIVQAKTMGIEELSFPNLTKLFLTHLHPDHTMGLPGLLIAPWVRGRTSVIDIFGPTGTSQLVNGILESYKSGINEHLNHGPVNLHEIDKQVTEFIAGIIYQDHLVEVEAVAVDHGTFDAYGFIFRTRDKTIVISGDTCPVPHLYKKIIDCDILIHEVYCQAAILKMPEKFRNYFSKVHTSGMELGNIANEVNPGLLVLTHQILYGQSTEDLIKEVRSNYNGKIVYGNDLDVFE